MTQQVTTLRQFKALAEAAGYEVIVYRKAFVLMVEDDLPEFEKTPEGIEQALLVLNELVRSEEEYAAT